MVSLTVSKTMHVNVFSRPLISRSLSTTNLPIASTFSARSFINKSQLPVIICTSCTSGNRAISSATFLWETGVPSGPEVVYETDARMNAAVPKSSFSGATIARYCLIIPCSSMRLIFAKTVVIGALTFFAIWLAVSLLFSWMS